MSRGLLHSEDLTSVQSESGGSLVTLRCDDSMPLEDRVDLLSYTFAKTVQGAHLRRIVHWNVCDGMVAFIIDGGPNPHVPRGQVVVDVDEWPPPQG